jgi:hypothetical protein
MIHDPPHGALHVLASVNNGAHITDGNSFTPAQVLMKTTGGYKGRSARGRKSANGTKQTYEGEAKLSAQQRKKRRSSNLAMKGPPHVETHGNLLGQKPITRACQSWVENDPEG